MNETEEEEGEKGGRRRRGKKIEDGGVGRPGKMEGGGRGGTEGDE